MRNTQKERFYWKI